MTSIVRKLLATAQGRMRTRPAQDLFDKRCDCAVSLIDRRTGQTPHVNGRPITIFTRDPAAAAAELLCGRDRAVWDIRVQALYPGGV